MATPPKAHFRPMPDERQAITHRFSIGGYYGFLVVGLFEDGVPGEISISLDREGGFISSLLQAFSEAVSLGLQHGVPLDWFVRSYIHTQFEPNGFTQNKEIAIAHSVADYVFRWLDLKFNPPTEDEEDGDETEIIIDEIKPLNSPIREFKQTFMHKFTLGGYEGYLSAGNFPDGQPAEIFLVMSRDQTCISGLLDSFARAISLNLQHGVPLETMVKKFVNNRFEPNGQTDDPDIPTALSVVDYVFRYLAKYFLSSGILEHADSAAEAGLDPKPKLTGSFGRQLEADFRLLPVQSNLPEMAEADLEEMPSCPTDGCNGVVVQEGSKFRCTGCNTKW